MVCRRERRTPQRRGLARTFKTNGDSADSGAMPLTGPRITLRAKLLAALASVVVLTVAVGWAGLQGMGEANRRLRAVHEQNVARLVLITETVDDARDMRERVLLHVILDDGAEHRELDATIAALDQRVTGQIDSLADEESGSAVHDTVERLRRAWQTYVTHRDTATLPLSRLNRDAEAEAQARIGATIFDEIASSLDELVRVNETDVERRLDDAERNLASGRRAIFVAAGGAAVLALAVATALARNVANRVTAVANAAGAMASGDLSQRAPVSGSDEIADLAAAFNRMADEQQSTIGSLERIGRENELILNSAGDGIYRIDTAGLITYVNPAASAILGASQEDLLHCSAHETVHHSRPDGTPYPKGACPMYAALSTGVSAAVDDEVFWRADGTSVPVEYIAAPIREGGDIVGVVVIFKDIAARRAEQEALRAARDQAMEASRLKSEFLATMSHEIRTPMNGVIGLTGLLLDTPLSQEQRQYAEGVRTAADALLAIINDILDFSKIEAGRIELERADFDVVEVVEEVAELLAEMARSKGLEVLSYCYPDVPNHVRGDPGRVRQVLLNLVSNAVKFTHQGEVVVRARLEQRSPSGTIIRFEVADTGIGIAQPDQLRLFDAFSQADASTTRKYGGTGLGLAVSKRLVELMGGEIGVASEPGKGSTFWFTARLDEVEDDGVPREPRILDGLRVLVVDDNPTNRMILSRQVASWGMSCDQAAGGSEALALVERARDGGHPYDLAILDFHMPEMDGLELASAITANSDHELPLVLLTSGGDVPDEARRQAGIRVALSKPVRQSYLYDSLMRAIGASRAPAPDVHARDPQATAGPAKAHLLVVEDNAINQTVATGILSRLGYSTDVANHGREAVEAVATKDYDAVLMDCQMPEMDGYQATVEIRSRGGRGRRLPIIAMTAAAMEGDRERALAAGMNDYITKPVDPTELAATLDRWLVPGPVHAGGDDPDAESDPASDDGAAPVDPARLDLLRRLDPTGEENLLDKLATTFATEADVRLGELRDAALLGDARQVERSAHALKGSAANLGMTRVAQLASSLEHNAHDGELADVERVLSALTDELDRANAAFREAVAGAP